MTPLPDDPCVVLVTVGKSDEALQIAEALVAERLAACCNITLAVRSIYRWKGEVCREEETLLIIKTRGSLFEALRARVAEMHSYTVPEIIALPIEAGHAPYLQWLRDETAPAPRPHVAPPPSAEDMAPPPFGANPPQGEPPAENPE